MQLGLRYDTARLWRYSPLQSKFAARELARYGIDSRALDSVRVLLDVGSGQERLLSSSDAARTFLRSLSAQIPLWVVGQFGGSLGFKRVREKGKAGNFPAASDFRDYVALCGIWSILALAAILPMAVREWTYRLIARNRYRLFGRYDTCKLPSPDQEQLFIWD